MSPESPKKDLYGWIYGAWSKEEEYESVEARINWFGGTLLGHEISQSGKDPREGALLLSMVASRSLEKTKAYAKESWNA